jgi:hypothetical protein
MDGIQKFVRWGRRGSGGLAMHGVMRALIARWLALITILGLLARCCYQSHTMRALWAVACAANELPVRLELSFSPKPRGR